MSRARRWIAAGGLLLAAGVLTLLSTWRHWAPCRTGQATRACLDRQESTLGLPVWSVGVEADLPGIVLLVVAAVLLGMAWVIAVGWRRRNVAQLLVIGMVALQPLVGAAAAEVAVALPARELPAVVTAWFMWPGEMLVFPFLLGAGWIVEERPVPTLRLLLLGWGVTSFGPMHGFADEAIARGIAPGTIVPPGLGYLTAAGLILLGGAVVGITLVLRPRLGRPEEPDERPGRDGLTLAA